MVVNNIQRPEARPRGNVQPRPLHLIGKAVEAVAGLVIGTEAEAMGIGSGSARKGIIDSPRTESKRPMRWLETGRTRLEAKILCK